MKKSFLILSLIILFSSCEENIDIRDQYVGNWNASLIGNMNMLYNGQVIGTIPLNQSWTSNISKSLGSSTTLIIDDWECIVSGDKLLFDSQTETMYEDGFTLQVTVNRSGNLSNNIISVQETYSGIWQTQSTNGIITGNTTATFTKK